MRKRITRIAPLQLGKVFAVLYAIFSIPIAFIMALAAIFGSSTTAPSWGMIIAIPIFYVVFGFLFMALAAWIYNVVAGWTGGVEFVSEEMPDS
jgi:uncharacterized oligopeptide transporter (OPT) family protein